MEAFRKWKETHPDLWEFILFNILSNCATVTNFVVLWLSSAFLFSSMTQPFQFFIFDYSSPSSGGLGGFLAFLLAYVCAQIVNYIVQRKLVFGATIDIRMGSKPNTQRGVTDADLPYSFTNELKKK